jgi:hypothetical protein
MNDCELFEAKYLEWKEGRLPSADAASLEAHAHSCPGCSTLSSPQARLHHLLREQPLYRPRAGFEMRLQQAIQSGSARSIAIPRTQGGLGRIAAVSAGLATGLAVGLLVLTSPVSENGKQELASRKLPPATDLAAKVDPSPTPRDTVTEDRDSLSESPSSYDASSHSRMVSGR